MANNRTFYAIEQVAIRKRKDTVHAASDWQYPHGVQSVAINTTFAFESVFELGQIELYEYVEDVPTIEVTLNKVLDGTVPLWFLSTDNSVDTENIVGRAKYRIDLSMNIYPDTYTRATGIGVQESSCLASGLYLTNATYTFPVTGQCSEALTYSGNDKSWQTGSGVHVPSGQFEVPAEKATVIGSGVQRRENFDTTNSIFPTAIPTDERIQTLTVTCPLARTDIFELGARRPYFKSTNYPIEVTAAIEVITAAGDLVDAVSTDAGNPAFQNNQRVYAILDSGFSVDLGSGCTLTSITHGGGEAGGGNMTVTYNFTTFNEFDINHTNATFTGTGIQP